MRTMSDNELRATCFSALVKQVGYLGTERFIVLMNRNPEDYTAWHERQPDSEESIEDLGARIMAFSKRQAESAVV